CNDQRNRKLVRLPGIDCCNQEHRFARERNAHTFYRYKDKDRPVAIGGQEMLKIGGSHMQHLIRAFALSRNNSKEGRRIPVRAATFRRGWSYLLLLPYNTR